MKKALALVILMAGFAAKAQFIPIITEPDKECFVELQRFDGTKAKQRVPRQAHVRLSKNELNVAFFAKRYNGGQPQAADFIFEDAKTKKIEVVSSVIGEDWTWDFHHRTPYGIAHVTCGNSLR